MIDVGVRYEDSFVGTTNFVGRKERNGATEATMTLFVQQDNDVIVNVNQLHFALGSYFFNFTLLESSQIFAELNGSVRSSGGWDGGYLLGDLNVSGAHCVGRRFSE